MRRSAIACISRCKLAAHLGLEFAVLGPALVQEALGDGQARGIAGERDAKLGALLLEIGAQAQKSAQNGAADVVTMTTAWTRWPRWISGVKCGCSMLNCTDI